MQAATAPAPAPAPSAAADLQQTVQAALQDLLSGVGLEHEDSWETPMLVPPRSCTGVPRMHPSRRTTGSSTATASARESAVACEQAASTLFASSSLAAAAAAGQAPVFADDGDGALQEGDLPPAAAVRLYAARLKAAKADLEGLQGALKGRDIKLSTLEKEVQQLR